MPLEPGGADGLALQLPLDGDAYEAVPEVRQALPLHPGSPGAEDDDLGSLLLLLWLPDIKSLSDRASLGLRPVSLGSGRGGASSCPRIVEGDCLGAVWWCPQGDRPS